MINRLRNKSEVFWFFCSQKNSASFLKKEAKISIGFDFR